MMPMMHDKLIFGYLAFFPIQTNIKFVANRVIEVEICYLQVLILKKSIYI
jgi:hypothetical protein